MQRPSGVPVNGLMHAYTVPFMCCLLLSVMKSMHFMSSICRYTSYECEKCQLLFMTEKDYLLHKKLHRGLLVVGQYQCHLCCYSTNISTNLHNHVATHSGERPHTCKICGKGFIQKVNLQTHLLTHAPPSERPHKCSICGKGFIQKRQLQAHMMKRH